VDLALAVRGMRPDLPVIIITGHGPTAEQSLAKAEGKFPVLPKPFAVADLVKLVHAELAKVAAVAKS
jgi:DNA-binding NtrC family response regulator